jgi:hypothetical protein
MPPVGEVSFELERFEWTADDQLEVVGRWNGVRGRRIGRPALTVDAGGRRQRVTGTQISGPDEPWRASFDWDGDRGEIAGAELEIGRSLVVELPPPRRRRRRGAASAESELRAQVDELRAMVASLQAGRPSDPGEVEALRADADRLPEVEAERDRLAAELEAAAEPDRLAEVEAERDRLAAELEAAGERDRLAAELETAAPSPEAEQELAGLRLAHGSLRAAHEQLEDELEAMRTVRDERDELAGQLQQQQASSGDEERERAALGDLIREVQERGSAAEAERDRLTTELSAARAEITELERRVAEQDESLAAARDDAERRVETERATTTEIHARLATAREAAQRSIIAEAEETEQLRAELARTRDDSERLLAAERAEVARLREEMLSSEVDETAEETSRRMIERITRDLERERAASRNLRRELDELRSDSAEHRRAVSSSTANGTLSRDDPPAAATAAGRAGGRAVRTPEGTQRRVAAARVASSQRVPKVPPSPYAIWAVRIGAALLAAAMLITLVVLVSLVT